MFNLFLDPFGLGTGQVYLVDHRDQIQIVVQRQIRIGQRLGFHALGCIDDQQCAFAGLQAASHFVRKVHMARRINQIELIHVAIFRFVAETDGMGFDGDAAFALQIHGVQHLLLHFTLAQVTAEFE